MILDLTFFAFSLLACAVVAYLVAMLWFSNIRTPQMKSFIFFGITAFSCIFFNGIMPVIGAANYTAIYIAHSVATCIAPYAFLWYGLNFSRSKLINSKPLIVALRIFPTLDVLLAATNPLHRLFLTSYDHGNIVTGSLFWVHAIFAYSAMVWGLFTVFRYVFRQVRNLWTIIAAFGTLVPIVLNLMMALGLLGTRFDFTSLGLFISFTLFYLTAYRSEQFSFKSVALTSIFTSLSDVTIIADQNGLIEDVNAAFHHNFPAFPLKLGETAVNEFAEWLSAHVAECHPIDLFTYVDDLAHPNERGEFSISPITCGVPTDDASQSEDIHTFSLRREVIRHRNNLSGFLITISDITEYHSMIREINKQKELAEQASKSKSIFLSDMSHEIRTPINAITGMVAIAQGTDDTEKIQDCLNKVATASRQLLALLNDVLDMSKIEANRMELSIEAFDLPAMFSNLKNIFEISAAAKKQNFEITVANDIPRITAGDEMRLSQIFLNLLSNAVKFTPENGNISLDVRLIETKDTMYSFEAAVKDDGVGITEEQQRRLFNSFEQAEKGTSKRFGGTGLGLAISKNLAKLMNGDITLSSEPGKGSCFTVQFCLHGENENVMDSDAADLYYDFSGKTALLAEDIVINQEIVLALLQDSGITVQCAMNGQEAVDLFLAEPERYDIIFMDIHMPVMDGYTATKIIRGSGVPTSDTVPIMAMTANAFTEDVHECYSAGMNDHIAKPIDFNLLFQKMSKHLDCNNP